jgi:YD repeat-containing protein
LQHFDGLLADVSALGTGAFDFVLTYSRQGVAYATETGTFTTSAGAGGTVTLTPAGASLVSSGFVQRQTRYNAFGEVVARGINGGFQEYLDYDNQGRLWRTNGGDGVDKVALYDLLGNSTADISSRSVDLKAGFTRPDDVAALAGTVRTESRYDALGRKIRQVLPSFVDATTGVTVTPAINQTLDRWGNVTSVSDPRLATWITQYRYNAFNQMIEQIQPDGNGAISAASPDTRQFYDKLGRNIATRDANGRLNAQRFDAAGDLVEEIHADGGHVRYGYNAYADRVKMVDAMGNSTAYTYDRVGNMLQAIRAAVAVHANDGLGTFLGTQTLTDTYVYDEAGRRIRVTNPANETTRYDYDTRQQPQDRGAQCQRRPRPLDLRLFRQADRAYRSRRGGLYLRLRPAQQSHLPDQYPRPESRVWLRRRRAAHRHHRQRDRPADDLRLRRRRTSCAGNHHAGRGDLSEQPHRLRHAGAARAGGRRALPPHARL